MASAVYPDDTKLSSLYGSYSETNSGVPYQQVPPPSYSPHSVASSQPQLPPASVYTQPITCTPVIDASILGHYPVSVQCPKCHQQVVTLVRYSIGGGTWLMSLFICLFGGIFGCCLIPFYVSAFKDAVHMCPSCQNVIGYHNLI